MAYPIELATIDGKGKGFIASHDIQSGEKILCCAPLVHCPRVNPSNTSQLITCSGCLSTTKLTLCSICQVASHCPNCATDPYQTAIHQEECSVLSNLRLQKQDLESYLEIRILVRLLGILRLSKTSQLPEINASLLAGPDDDVIVDDVDILKDMMSGVHGGSDGEMSTEQYQNCMNSAKATKYLIESRNRRNIEYYVQLLGNFQLNNFECMLHQGNGSGNSSLGQGVYPTAAVFNHSCDPNVRNECDDSGCLSFYTTRNCVKGEELCFPYVDSGMSRSERMKKLRERYGFDCCCERCGDL